MIIKRINPDTLSLSELRSNAERLYCITNEINDSYVMNSLMGQSLDFFRKDHVILMITEGDEEEDISKQADTEKEKPARMHGNRHRTALTYKFFGNDATESIFVEFRPESGGIRVSFNDKESAQAYFEYFREQFYTSTTGASVITVSNIYKDLNLVNWDPESCDDWGWYTLDAGTCRYISSGVTKNKNSKRFGFTLNKPTKLYESKKREEN